MTQALFEKVEVGMFKLPGICFEKGQIPTELHEEMSAWAKENHCGTAMSDRLWSFKSEEKRDWFILRWSDSIPKQELKSNEDFAEQAKQIVGSLNIKPVAP